MVSFVRRGPRADRSASGAESAAAPDGLVVQLDEDEAIAVSRAEVSGDEVSGPDRGSARPPRSQFVRLGALVLVIVLGVVLATVLLRSTGAPTIGELRRRAGLEGKQELWVGVSGDVPAISNRQPDGSYTGFDVDIAYMVAQGLGFKRWQVHFFEVTPENRQRMIGLEYGGTTYKSLDLVVAAYSITDDRKEQGAVFAGPYLRTETSVLTRRDHAPVESLADLGRGRGKDGAAPQRVCAPGTTTSSRRLMVESRAEIHVRQRNSECVRGLLNEDFDAVVTDAAILAGFAAQHPSELKLNNITSTDDEWWGIGVGYDPNGTDDLVEARRQLVLLILGDALGGTRWDTAYDSNLRRLEGIVHPEPGESPQQIAQDRQPAPEVKVSIRRWPWERLGDDPGQ